jgi:hypothetical protein
MHFGTEQNVGPKPPDGPFRNGSFVGGGSVNMVVRASHRISSYSYSAKRYSVKRYSYSMAV